jgi:hypothetical protein
VLHIGTTTAIVNAEYISNFLSYFLIKGMIKTQDSDDICHGTSGTLLQYVRGVQQNTKKYEVTARRTRSKNVR